MSNESKALEPTEDTLEKMLREFAMACTYGDLPERKDKADAIRCEVLRQHAEIESLRAQIEGVTENYNNLLAMVYADSPQFAEAAPPNQGEAMSLTDEQIRKAGGIVHRDGNIFFTSIVQLNRAIESAATDPLLERIAGLERDMAAMTAKLTVERSYSEELEALRKDAGWQPIETAPKDGTVIMLGRAADDHEDRAAISVPGRWFEGYEDSVDDMGHNDGFMDLEFQEFTCPRMFGAEKYRTEGNQPTRWMPLPPPPDAAKEQE